MTDTRLHTISELAKEFDVTTRTIRFYEEKGLIHPAREGQKRLYTSLFYPSDAADEQRVV